MDKTITLNLSYNFQENAYNYLNTSYAWHKILSNIKIYLLRLPSSLLSFIELQKCILSHFVLIPSLTFSCIVLHLFPWVSCELPYLLCSHRYSIKLLIIFFLYNFVICLIFLCFLVLIPEPSPRSRGQIVLF